jgi:NADPH-dependent ferric siderophore reductase/aryl carrier-like protein
MTIADRLLVDIAEVLEEDLSGIGPDDNLLENGIDSVRLMILLERWQSTGLDVDFAGLARNPTLTGWADLLAAAGVPATRQEPAAVVLTVQRVEQLTPRTLRITLTGPQVTRFVAAGPADYAVLTLPDGAQRPVTVRYHGGSGEVDIDIVAHEHGPMGRWAAQVMPGESVTLTGPFPARSIPAADWSLIVADLAALPAAAQRVERARAGSRMVVLAVVPDAAEEILMPTAADVTVVWLPTDAALADRIAHLTLPPGPGTAWAAGGPEVIDAAGRALAARPEFGNRVCAEQYRTA